MNDTWFQSVLASMAGLSDEQCMTLLETAAGSELLHDRVARHAHLHWHHRYRDRILFHHPYRLAGSGAEVRTVPVADDRALVERIVAAYRRAASTPLGDVRNMWLTDLAGVKSDAAQLLDQPDLESIGEMLRDPASWKLLHGFDFYVPLEKADDWVAWWHLYTYDALLQLCRATGARRVEYPEAHVDFAEAPDPEDLLTTLDEMLGFRVDFPNIFPGEAGLQTSRGVISYRAVQALYQAWRIKHTLSGPGAARVLEIGAGLGRTAYYAVKMGVAQYTIIDLPLSSVPQGYFLGRALGEGSVALWGEEGRASVRILPPAAFGDLNEQFDLILNCDSLTEMSEATARAYLAGAPRLTRTFLSINHEFNPFTVQSLYHRDSRIRAWRSPCWVRKGYVEELLDLSRLR
jgi:hypothetical protein